MEAVTQAPACDEGSAAAGGVRPLTRLVYMHWEHYRLDIISLAFRVQGLGFLGATQYNSSLRFLLQGPLTFHPAGFGAHDKARAQGVKASALVPTTLDSKGCLGFWNLVCGLGSGLRSLGAKALEL